MKAAPLEGLWAGPDWLRERWYRFSVPLLGPLVGDRELRVRVLAGVSLALSFTLAVLWPRWLLALGPLLLGVPHLLADVRALVLKPGFQRRPELLVAAAAVLTVGVGGPAWAGVLAVPAAALAARGVARGRQAAVALGGLALAGVAAWKDWGFTVLFLHLHNLVALLAWGWLRRGPASTARWVTAASLVATGVLLSGAVDHVVGWAGPSSSAGWDELTATLGPVGSDALSVRLVVAFAFLQSVHYGVWVRLVPEDLRSRTAPRPFVASWRALVADFGLAPMVGVGLTAVALLAWGCADLGAARLGYLRVAAFHGYLELAALALLWLEGGRAATWPR